MATKPVSGGSNTHIDVSLVDSEPDWSDDLTRAEVDDSATPVGTDVSKHARRVAAHADQERLVRRFIDVSHERLAGRHTAAHRLLGRQPRERVVLGVLAPQDPPPPEVPVVARDLPAEPGVPVDQLPASEFGLTCLVQPKDGRLTVNVKVRLALYLQHYPTYQEQFEHAALLASMEAAQTEDVRASVTGSSDGVAEEASESDDQLAGRGEPGMDGRAPTIVGSVAADHAVGVSSGNPAERSTAKRRKREASDPIRLVYQRHDVAATLQLNIPVPQSSVPITVDDQGALHSAAMRAVESRAGVGATSGTRAAGGQYRRSPAPPNVFRVRP